MELSEEIITVLSALQANLRMIGSANDAEDHGYLDEAERIRRESRITIRDMVNENKFLLDLFPTLEQELDSERLLLFSWADLCRLIDEKMQESTDE